MSSPEHDLPFAESAAAAASAPSALIETTLQRARISVLHPSRVVIVGDGLRLRIDHHGVTRQRLADVRLTLPVPGQATVDPDLQQTLARWAGHGTELDVHELVRSGQAFTRQVHLVDVTGTQATLDHRSGRAPA